MVRKSPKGRGGRKTNNPPGIEGASIAGGGSIVILEMSPRPGFIHQAVERIRETTSCDVIAVISILDREEGGVEAFAEQEFRLKASSHVPISLSR